jgi:hypothetical protein
MSTSTVARVLAAARGTAGRCGCAAVAGAGCTCAPSSAQTNASDAITKKREANIDDSRLMVEALTI